MKREDKKIQELLKGNFSSEELPLGFTNLVMDKVLQIEAEQRKQFVYTPVISKLGWSVICMFFIGLLFTVNTPFERTWDLNQYLQVFNFSTLQSSIVSLSIVSIFLSLLGERLLTSLKETLAKAS
jgi:hypothetical protein